MTYMYVPWELIWNIDGHLKVLFQNSIGLEGLNLMKKAEKRTCFPEFLTLGE